MKTWNLGNTTVRNPERIKAGLRILKENFEGKVFDLDAQKEFFEALLSAGVIEGDPPQERNRAASGRKWQSVCNKLGLVQRSTRIHGIISVTDAGNALLSEEVLESDVYLRQMLKVQLPSPTESNLEGAAIHPFYLVLAVSVRLDEQGLKGLTKEEIALYLQSATSDGQVDEIVEKIKTYRTQRDAIEGRTGKRRFFLEKLTLKAQELYADAVNKQKIETLQTYSDTTARYSAITGIFGIGRQSLVIKEDQINLAKAIIDKGSPAILEDEEFLDIFHNPMLPALPTDNTDFLKHDINALSERLSGLAGETGAQLRERTDVSKANIIQLKRRREDLEQELITQKEMQFYREQGQSDQVSDILSLFESIKAREIIGGSDYMPAWAEWGVWRVFLSINTIANPISETRGFKINSELYPIHHAKGGAADLRFEYEDNTIIPAEVTLNTGERQYAAEREPVRNHVLKLIEINPSVSVIGVFVAPVIQPRTAHDFFSVHQSGDYSQALNRVVPIDIVPLTIEQLCRFLPGQSQGCNDYSELRAKLDEILLLREHCHNGNEWLSSIEHYFINSVV